MPALKKPKWFDLILLLAVLAIMALFVSMRQRDKESHEESGQPDYSQEQVGRSIVMVARGWTSWPTEAALSACEWDPTGNFHLVTPCEDESGLVFYRNPWMPKKWKPWQRSEL